MANFDTRDIAVRRELEQRIAEYWHEVDVNNGAHATDFFTEDCKADLTGLVFEGHAGVRTYFADRMTKNRNGLRQTRHVISNMRIRPEGLDSATADFIVTSFGAEGPPPQENATLPAAISEATFECRRHADGDDAAGAARRGQDVGKLVFVPPSRPAA